MIMVIYVRYFSSLCYFFDYSQFFFVSVDFVEKLTVSKCILILHSQFFESDFHGRDG